MDTTRRDRRITIDDFLCDSHAARYQGEFVSHPRAVDRLLGILNDPASDQRLEDAERHGRPALSGIVDVLEQDDAISEILAAGPAGYRFRQTVGVAVKLKMAALGWTTTGRKGTVRGSHYFTKAERYQPTSSDTSYRRRATEGLDALARIGDDEERDSTRQAALAGLAATRRAESRPF